MAVSFSSPIRQTKEQTISLVEKMDIIKGWWKEL